MQPKTIKSKNNGCGTAPGNLVYIHKALEKSDLREIEHKHWT